MRWILVALLMCNGIYFFWQSSQDSQQEFLTKPKRASAQNTVELRVVGEESSGAGVAEEVVAAGSNRFAGSKAENSPNICWLIGPFMERVSGRQVVSRLQALDIALKLETLEFKGEPDYWVHIPAQVSRKAAIKLLRELQAKKIDGFLITEGDLVEGISLGFFTQKMRAEAVYSERREQGYDAQIKVVPRIYTEMWAVFDSGEYGKFSNELWEKIKEGNQGLERRKNYCDKIASVGNLD